MQKLEVLDFSLKKNKWIPQNIGKNLKTDIRNNKICKEENDKTNINIDIHYYLP